MARFSYDGFDPPAHLVTEPPPQWVEIAATVFPALGLGLLLGYAVRERGRSGPVLAALLAGGTLCIFNEAFIDVLGKVYLREQDTTVAFHMLGRALPLWAVFFCGLFWGGQVYVFYRLLQSNPTPRRYWQVSGAVFFGAILLELPSTAFNLYDYYGHQPLNPTGYPLWWMFVYQSGPVASAILYKRPDLFAGPRLVLAALLVPAMEIGFLMFTGMPTIFALQANSSLWVTTSAACASGALAALVVINVGKAMVGAGPLEAFAGTERRTRLNQADRDERVPAVEAEV